MKFRLTHLAALTAVSGLTLSPAQAAENLRIDPDHTTVAFNVDHLGFSNISGRFSNISGTIALDREKLQDSSVKVQIATTSINSAHDKRDDHLRSKDFFDVAAFPTMTFNSTEILPVDRDNFQIKGLLTLLGVTKPLTLDAHFNGEGPNPFMPEQHTLGFSATGKLKRSEFGMEFGLPMIGDQVQLQLEVEAIRQ